MARQYVRYVLCDRNHHDATVHDCGPLNAVGILHRSLGTALRSEKDYLEGNPQAFIAKVTYERCRRKSNRRDGDGWWRDGQHNLMTRFIAPPSSCRTY
jgi:hypothetical protein